MENLIIAKKLEQNNQEFLLGVYKVKHIQKFTKYTERIIVGYIENEDANIDDDKSLILPDYNNQIQRKTNNAKVERIADYLITDPMAMFPTNIIIAIPEKVIEQRIEDESGNTIIYLNSIVAEELNKEKGNVFLTIIDGQHRVKGIERAIERLRLNIATTSGEERLSNEKTLNKLLNLDLIVTFFIDPVLEYQAMVFSIINKTQTKVPENLVYSLFGLTENDTPQKSSLEVVLALNGLQKSPIYNRIKLVGGNYKKGENIPLSQATMVKSILFNICKNQRESEIERNKNRNELKGNNHELPFRNYYANNNDRMIIRIMYSFFSAVKETFIDENGNSYWDLSSNLNVLQTNVGFQALMKILKDILKTAPEEKKDQKLYYSEILERAKNIDFADLGEEKRYPFTSKSIKVLYNDFREKIGL